METIIMKSVIRVFGMRIVLFLFCLFASAPVCAAESIFLDEISDMVSIRPGQTSHENGMLVLDDCRITISDYGEGTIGRVVIADDAPGRVGRLYIEDLKIAGFQIQKLQLEDFRGNFALMALTIPLVWQLQLSSVAKPKDVYKLLPAFQKIPLAFSRYHLGRLRAKGLRLSQQPASLKIGSIDAKDLSLAKSGSQVVKNVILQIGPVTMFSMEEGGVRDSEFPGLLEALKMNPHKLENGDLTEEEFARISEISIHDLYLRNLEAPVIGLGIANIKMDLTSKAGSAKGDLKMDGLTMSGSVLEMTGLQNVPDTLNMNMSFSFVSKLSNGEFALAPRFSMDAQDMFGAQGKGQMDVSDTDADPNLKSVALRFVNYGLINMIPNREKLEFLHMVESRAPFILPVLTSLFSGEIKGFTLKIGDLEKPETIAITTE